MSITKRVTFIAKDGCEDKLKELLTAIVEPSKKENGCIFYDIFQYKNNPKKFSAIESWEDEEALNGHKNTRHCVIYKSSYEPYCQAKYADELEI